MGTITQHITVEKLCQKEINGQTELSVTLVAPQLNWVDKKLWIRFPKALSAYVTDSYDPFLAALLPLAMKTSSHLMLEGSVSERLMANSVQILKMLSDRFDSFNSINIKINSLQSSRHVSKAVASFFTCGVDSFYTVLKNLDLYKNESRISHLLYVHGFDVDANNQELFCTVKKEIDTVAGKLNLNPIFIRTNLRQITDPYTLWGEEQHGASLGSVGLCLSELFNTIYIPSSFTYAEAFKWGSHPLVDPLWSNNKTKFIHDGNEANRTQKVLWQLSSSEVAMECLRVCWENPDNKYNCGICAKCIRTKINLKLAGALEKCRTLNNEIDISKYEAILKKSSTERRMLAEIIKSLPNSKTNNEFKEKFKSIIHLANKKQNVFSFKKLLHRYF